MFNRNRTSNRSGFNSFMNRNNFETAIDLSRFPAINAMRASGNVSSKYAFIPTTRALAVLNDYGWIPVQAMEARTRVEANQGFQKHSIRLSNPRLMTELQVGSTVPQILLTNSHSGSAAFDLSIALFEKVCSNGLIVARGNMEEIRVYHRGYADQNMEAALLEIMPEIEPTLELTDQFKKLQLSDAERKLFAESAIDLRWDGEQFAVNPDAILWTGRRAERETAASLWTTYNVVQEHVIEGGVNQRDVRNGSKTYGRQRRSKRVSGLDENQKLNRALWRLTERMAELKASQ